MYRTSKRFFIFCWSFIESRKVCSACQYFWWNNRLHFVHELWYFYYDVSVYLIFISWQLLMTMTWQFLQQTFCLANQVLSIALYCLPKGGWLWMNTLLDGRVNYQLAQFVLARDQLLTFTLLPRNRTPGRLLELQHTCTKCTFQCHQLHQTQ